MITRFFSLLGDTYQNRKMILSLAKNDFKTKYAGSYLGIIWAFIQPLVTILVYWFVFSHLKAGAQRDVPFVLWLVAGLVPWFFFQDGLNSGTSSLIEYSYLVKKVVFQINVLPMVKVISALFVHLAFIGICLLLYITMGYVPGVSAVQILYYSFAVFVLVLGMSYFTSAVVVFFRDLSQFINICLQVGVWMTPIMWNFQDFHLAAPLQFILKLNPMFYIVEGYRDALISGRWFWERPVLTAYFWMVTILMFVIGTRVFRKLKIHFADVL